MQVNKVKFSLLVVLILALVQYSTIIYAVENTHIGKIERIYTKPNGDILFKIYRKSGCAPIHPNHYYSLSKDAPSFDVSYSLLLSAAYVEKEVSVRIDDAACNASTFSSNVLYMLVDF